jgi:O-antigen/teichoic acid export membrane protein
MADASDNVALGYRLPLLGRARRRWEALRANNPDDHGAQRWRRIFISAGGALAARAVAMACSLLTIPVALAHLGAERYGVWITLTSAVGMLSFLDFGIGIGLQNRVAELMGKGQLAVLADVLRSTWVVLAAVALGIVSVLVAGILTTGLASALFPGAAFAAVDLDRVLVVIAAAFGLGLPLSLFSRVALGLQQGWIAAVATSSGTLLTLLAVSFAAMSGVGFFTFVLLAFVLVRQRLKGLALFGPVSLPEGWRTLRQGSRYVLPQVAGAIMAQGPVVLLGTLSSPVNAAIYSVLARISLPFQQLQQMFLEQIWPALTEALHRGDMSWLRATLRRVLRTNVLFSVLVAAVVVFGVAVLFPLLTRSASIAPSLGVVLLFAAHIGVMSLTQGFAYVANGLARLRLQNVFAAVCVVFVFTVLPMAANRFGLEGLLLGLIFLNGLVGIPLLQREYARFLAENAPSRVQGEGSRC